MKKRYIYLITFLLFILAAGFVVIRYKKKQEDEAASFYPLKDRKTGSYQMDEWKQVQKRFDDLLKIVKTNPGDTRSRIGLAALYIQEARATGNYMYYDMAAMKYVNEVLDKEPDNFERV